MKRAEVSLKPRLEGGLLVVAGLAVLLPDLDSLSRSPPPASSFPLSSHTAVYLFSGDGSRRLISYITTFNTQRCHYAINTKELSDSAACRRVFGFFPQWAAEC